MLMADDMTQELWIEEHVGIAPLKISAFQERVMLLPETTDVLLAGGRGGGKSYTLNLLALRHAEMYGINSRTLYVRQTVPACQDFVSLSREVFTKAYGAQARYNASSHIWTLPTGGVLEIGPLADPSDFSRYQGRSFNLLLIDEAQQWHDPSLLDLLRSNLRGPSNMPVRVVMAANPGGVGHQWIAQRYVFKASPWKPFTEEQSGRQWVVCPSTYLDNEHIDRQEYHRQIEAATVTDPELGRAWLEGDWTVARGAYFGDNISEDRNRIDPWPTHTS